MKGPFFISFALCVFAIGSMSAQSVYPGQHRGKLTKDKVPQTDACAFDLKDVRLTDSPFKSNLERESVWLMSISADRLLHGFRNTAGVWAGLEGGYSSVGKLGGWESLDCELRGHTTGHVLSALAYLYASTGEEKYRTKADSLVSGLAEVQDALRPYHQGFIAAWSENLIDRVIAGQRVWAPWYTLHKIYAGLIDQYLYGDNEKALSIMVEAAGWAYDKLLPLTEGARKTMLRNEFGGVNEAFYNLYSITGDERHLWLAEFFYHNDVIDPLAECRDELAGKHANTFIPKVIAEARNYELRGVERSREIACHFWNTVVGTQTFCTGGNSHKEKFIPSGEISRHLTGYTQETCNTNNMLKLTRHLFCWTADARYADYYETALYNHILGQQDPQSGMVAYFLPLLPGAHKVYSTPEHSFWCCVGTGFENHAKYGEAIYYHSADELYVNLFIPSVIDWRDKGVRVEQQTRFPENGKIGLTVHCAHPSSWTLKLRYPVWASGAEVKINGKPHRFTAIPGSYIDVGRTWKNGDRIEIAYGMELRLVEANDDPDKAAVAYGPLILAGMAGTEAMVDPAPFSNPELHNDYYTYDYRVPETIPLSLTVDREKLSRSILPVEGQPLRFVTQEGVTLAPIHQIHRQRYVVYWDIRDK